MKNLLYLSIFCLLGINCSTQKVQSSNDKYDSKPPNLVLILADDLGYADVGFNGCKDIPTPNIDRIAKEGIKCTNAYVTWGACGPSRAGMITGRYQDKFGFSRNPLFAPNDPNQGLPLSELMLSEALQQANYKSAVLGKWHLGAHPSQRPLKRGFDDFFGFLTGGHKYFPEEWTLADEYEVTAQFEAYKTKLLRNNERIEETEYLTDALSREAVNYIGKYKDNPFFIYLAYNAPHGPLQATEKYLQRFPNIPNKKRKTYAAMVSAVDDGVGLVLDQLKKMGVEDNTIVVFLSDNGGPSHKNGSNNKPLRGRKGQLFEGGIRVPFALRWPAQIKQGMVYDKPISSMDIFATMVAQNEGKIQLKNELDGVDLLPYFKGENKGLPHEKLLWRIHDRGEVAIRQINDKLIIGDGEPQLFDLKADLGETHNKGVTPTELFQQLEQEQQEWLSNMKPPAFLGLGQNKEYDELNPDRFKRPEIVKK